MLNCGLGELSVEWRRILRIVVGDIVVILREVSVLVIILVIDCWILLLLFEQRVYI